MRLDEIFSQLLTDKQIALVLSPAHAESLRVSLLRKLKSYKEEMERLGWMTEELASETISVQKPGRDAPPETANVFHFFLRPPKKRGIEYTVLSLPISSSEEKSTHE